MGKVLFVMFIVLFTAVTMNVSSKRLKRPQGKCIQIIQNGTKISKPCSHDCPRGKELQRKCSVNNDCKCSKCRYGTFSNHRSKRCRPCSLCKRGYYAKKPCTSFRNTKCVKIKKCYHSNSLPNNNTGSYSNKREKCHYRLKDLQLRTFRISNRKVHNVTKMKCGEGFYLRRSGGFYSCMPCTSCKENETLLKNCKWKHDTMCGCKTVMQVSCLLATTIKGQRYFRENSTGKCQKCSLCLGKALDMNVTDEVVKECDHHPILRCMPVISLLTTSTEVSTLTKISQDITFTDYENSFASSVKQSKQSDVQWIFNIIIGLLSFVLVFLISMLLMCKFTLSRRKKKENNICFSPTTTKNKQNEMPFLLNRYIQDIEASAVSIKNCSEPGRYNSSFFPYIDSMNVPYTEGDRPHSVWTQKSKKKRMANNCEKTFSTIFDAKDYDEFNGDTSHDPKKNYLNPLYIITK